MTYEQINTLVKLIALKDVSLSVLLKIIFNKNIKKYDNTKITTTFISNNYSKLFFDKNTNITFYWDLFEDIDFILHDNIHFQVRNEKRDKALTRLKHFITTEETLC